MTRCTSYCTTWWPVHPHTSQKHRNTPLFFTDLWELEGSTVHGSFFMVQHVPLWNPWKQPWGLQLAPEHWVSVDTGTVDIVYFGTADLLSRGSNTSCLFFALKSFLIRPPSTFQNFFTFTLLPASSALLQTPKWPEFSILLHEIQWSALFLLPGSSFLEPAPCFCPSICLCHFF